MKQMKLIETNLLDGLIHTINGGKNKVVVQVNRTLTLVFCQVGKKINDFVLNGKCADYGKEIVKSISAELVEKFGRSFATRNLRRMMQFANFEIVPTLSAQLSWSHFSLSFPRSCVETRIKKNDY